MDGLKYMNGNHLENFNMNNCIYKGKIINSEQYICKNKEFSKESVIIRSDESCKVCKFKKWKNEK